MKYYKVIYYNGKTDQSTVVPGKSANEAMDKARELLRMMKEAGATVKSAVRFKPPFVVGNKVKFEKDGSIKDPKSIEYLIKLGRR